jgi:uncharacterized protein (TIGR00255 family)
MVRSMTGFGRADVRGDTLVVTVEARSVNHRHLDVALRLPRALAALELEARRVVGSRLERGRVDVSVQLTPVAGQPTQRVVTDVGLAREYVARARALVRDLDDLGVGGEVPLQWVLERPGVVRLEDAEPGDATVPWTTLEEALGRALDELLERRGAEGERLAHELRSLHAELAAIVETMAARAPAGTRRREERLRERLASLLGGGVDEARILTEAAVWADKADIDEELTRLRAHLAEVALVLDKGGPVGRTLDFLLQELGREVNTVASKADDLELSQAALAGKGVLEKMREQVQNLE